MVPICILQLLSLASALPSPDSLRISRQDDAGLRRAALDDPDITDDSSSTSEQLTINSVNPMSPYLQLKPFIPTKPGFIPPFVDPQFFIDKKAKMLNNLFPPVGPSLPDTDDSTVTDNPYSLPAGPGFFIDKKTKFLNTLFNQIGTPGITPSKVARGTLSRRHSVSIVPRLAADSPNPFSPISPKFFTDKKTEFLNKLFSTLNITADTDDTTEVSSDDLETVTKPTIVPPGFWLPPVVPVVPTSKPTIVPPGFWSPFASSVSFPFSPLVKGVPVYDPAISVSNTKILPSKTIPNTVSYDSSGSELLTSDALESVYTQKVGEFLDKLFNSINISQFASKLNDSTKGQKRNVDDVDKAKIKVMDQLLENIASELGAPELGAAPEEYLSRRSLTEGVPNSLVSNAKDTMSENIFNELSSIKNSILDTVTEIIQKQKEEIVTTPKSTSSKKKPGVPFVSPYATMWGKKPMVAPTADPLEPLNMKLKYLSQVFDMLTGLEKNISLAINKVSADTSVSPVTPASEKTPQDSSDSVVLTSTNKVARDLISQLNVPSSDTSYDPSLSTQEIADTKTKALLGKILGKLVEEEAAVGGANSKLRSIKMSVHQGYQSLPPGSEELLQAGGGGEPMKQEGGGLKLQNPGSAGELKEWACSGHHNHHN